MPSLASPSSFKGNLLEFKNEVRKGIPPPHHALTSLLSLSLHHALTILLSLSLSTLPTMPSLAFSLSPPHPTHHALTSLLSLSPPHPTHASSAQWNL